MSLGSTGFATTGISGPTFVSVTGLSTIGIGMDGSMLAGGVAFSSRGNAAIVSAPTAIGAGSFGCGSMTTGVGIGVWISTGGCGTTFFGLLFDAMTSGGV